MYELELLIMISQSDIFKMSFFVQPPVQTIKTIFTVINDKAIQQIVFFFNQLIIASFVLNKPWIKQLSKM